MSDLDLAYLTQDINTLIEQQTAADPYPQPENDEIALRALGTHAGLHLRKDGVVDLFAGPGHLVIDPETSAVIAQATRLIGLLTQFDLAGLSRFSLNQQDLNPLWWQKVTADVTIVKPLYDGALDAIYVLPDEDPNSIPISLSTYLETATLFLPARTTEDLLGSLGPWIQSLS